MSDTIPSSLKAFTWHYLKDKKLYLFGFFIVSLVWAIEMSLSPYLLGMIINTITNTKESKETIINTLMRPAILYVCMSFLLNLNFRFFGYLCLKLYPTIKANVIRDMYGYLIRHSHDFFQNNFVGSLTKKIQDMATNIEQLIQIPNEWFYPRLMALIIASGTLYYALSPLFAIILLVWGVCFVFITYLASKTSAKHANNLSSAEANISGILSDSISNIVSTTLFSNVKHEINRSQSFIDTMSKCDRRLQWQNQKVFFVQGIGVTVLIGSMMTALIHGYLHNKVTPGDFALVLSLSLSFIMSIFNMGQEIMRFSKVIGTCQQSLTFMQVPHAIIDLPNAPALQVPKGNIEYKNVSFAYLEKKSLFSDINFTIIPGEKMGLVGFSGAGKSTFVKLLLRLIEPQSGQILIDNQDIRTVNKDSLQKNIATIPQETELFHRSIMENIRFAKINATDEEIISAAQKAKCHDFITKLPEGYDALVGERGVKLSGGQKQRIAIARAFLKNAPLLILDEATSSLDSVTEQEIQTSLHQVMDGRTAIVIAHRLSTLKHMDRIAVFDNGAIIEIGRPATLLQNENSVFKQLWQMQSDGFLLSVDKD
jgi:ATP-binding cassette subfamily B protein